MSQKTSFFAKFANGVADFTGKPLMFGIALAAVVIWAVTGPLFGFSETWQLVINTGTTIVTFLMVFILQNSQNRDGKALQAKLDELILSSSAENRFIGIEKLDEQELKHLKTILQEKANGGDDCAEEVAGDVNKALEKADVVHAG
jgi:low affinity Fe/Cu permease